MDIFSHKNRMTALVLTSDKRYAVSASEDNKIKVWDVHAKTTVRTLSGHTAGVNDVVLPQIIPVSYQLQMMRLLKFGI